MVIDTSALLAILQDEPERRRFNELIEAAGTCALSTSNFVETSIAIEVRYGAEGVRDLDEFIRRGGIELVAVTGDHAERARRAVIQFGRGRHPARLNFGDCFAYALAQAREEPLLFKGNDFSQTDVTTAG